MPAISALPLGAEWGHVNRRFLLEGPINPLPLLVCGYSTGDCSVSVPLTSAGSSFLSSEIWLHAQSRLNCQSIILQPITAASHLNYMICIYLINTKSFFNHLTTETDFLLPLHMLQRKVCWVSCASQSPPLPPCCWCSSAHRDLPVLPARHFSGCSALCPTLQQSFY